MAKGDLKAYGRAYRKQEGNQLSRGHDPAEISKSGTTAYGTCPVNSQSIPAAGGPGFSTSLYCMYTVGTFRTYTGFPSS
ncbi:hypothetical protein BDW72DRAFT_177951 [Aspergillus terricola var. indicus]